jgi:hypothetical protein
MGNNQEAHAILMEEVNGGSLFKLAVLPDAPKDVTESKLGDQQNEHRGRTTEPEQPNSTPPAGPDNLAAHFSEDRYAEALETVRSARSSRSDTMYDETPPDFDVSTDKLFQLLGISFIRVDKC